jgi:hypothetical protein
MNARDRVRGLLDAPLTRSSSWLVLALIAVLAVLAGATIGIVSVLVLLGFWPFYKFGVWLLS